MIRSLKRLPKLATLAALYILAACSDNSGSLAPAGEPELLPAALPAVVAMDAVVAPEIDALPGSTHEGTLASYPSNATWYQFTYTPTSASTYVLGTHMVYFPAYTICDPAVSEYGPSTWMNSCSKLTAPITITAVTWTDAAGRPQIDFQNSIRFYPNWNGQLPAIYLRDPSAAITSWGRVDYCSAAGCVNEAATDGALTTQRDAATGFLFRLIRHFSGYNVWA
jgi:hypothetical protein